MCLVAKILIFLQPYSTTMRMDFLQFCGVGVGGDLNHVGFVIDMTLDAVALPRYEYSGTIVQITCHWNYGLIHWFRTWCGLLIASH